MVDVPVFLLHYAAVSPIGSAAKCTEQARQAVEMFPDVGCPQGRLMELNWHLSSIWARSWRNVLMMLVMDRLPILGQVFGFRDFFSLR
ncbi:hypothetical protein ALP77_100981 [Pseudomonas amygdali pv. tabaci]|nr:hypothetical protein ALO60_101047 [Pseudomonas amygdali pv. tabaci]RMR88404.1 hypothetical protein ALP77_100981 [Pseudomonas amygdali pv. tabaci]